MSKANMPSRTFDTACYDTLQATHFEVRSFPSYGDVGRITSWEVSVLSWCVHRCRRLMGQVILLCNIRHDFISAVTVTVQDEGIEFRAQDEVAGLCRFCLVFLGAHSPGDGPIGLRTIWIFFWNKVVFWILLGFLFLLGLSKISMSALLSVTDGVIMMAIGWREPSKLETEPRSVVLTCQSSELFVNFG